ncbi:MAG: PQQ-binding-like beta-propeller repeat protein [Phycisphaeraceae bacterium]
MIRTHFGRALFLAALALVACNSNPAVAAEDAKQLAAELYRESGVRGGLVAHLNCGDGTLTAALRLNDSYLVHGLTKSADDLTKARKTIQSLGIYGNVSVDRMTGQAADTLPYADNTVNFLVSDGSIAVTNDEVLRVLVPKGVALIQKNGKWDRTVKPMPGNTDEWTHYFHGPDGNAVAKDSAVDLPRHLQWLGGPRWSRHHDRMASMSAMVSSNGRMFYIMDEGSRVSILLPPKWMLKSRDAYNGVPLWERDIKNWHTHLFPLKSGPTQLARRLVSAGDRVYVTLGIDDPVTQLDAATGETIRVYEETKGAEEILEKDGMLYILAANEPWPMPDYATDEKIGPRTMGRAEGWETRSRRLVVVEAETGKVLWSKDRKVLPLSLSTDGTHLLFHDGENVVSVNPKTGAEIWKTPAGRRTVITTNISPRLLLYKDVVLFAGGDRMMHSFDLKTGTERWKAPHDQSGYMSPEDLLVTGGLVWTAPTTKTQDTGAFTGRDPQTGEVKITFPPDVSTYWFHHRCHIAKATDRFILPSRTGIEFVDFKSKDWTINHWVRGGCLYGVLPCNGLLYAPPNDCACFPEAKLYGINALAPVSASRSVASKLRAGSRIEKGPAYDEPMTDFTAGKDDWPTYRATNDRSGFTKQVVPASVEKKWEAKLGGRLSSLVVANGRVYVAQPDAHQVHALDQGTGEVVWSYTAGARVDSPPTIYKGRVLFGSNDGFVYCLRESDGALAWRFRAAPTDLRIIVFEQLESVWPVHGNILVQNDAAYFACGRSIFLDGGLRLFKLDPATGRILAEQVMDDKDPETGKDIQSRSQTLQMPVGLPDILSSDGKHVYMRSQRMDLDGKRQEIGPVSGNTQVQGSAQQGEGAHLFSPSGFLDDTWFHRAYWVFGKNFAGSHSGYFQAGKYAPAGRVLVFNEEHVFGFGRKPEFYKWTTPLEHQLFSTSRKAPEAPKPGGQVLNTTGMIAFTNSKSLDPAGKAIAVEAWVKAEGPNGVILARGGPLNGYALILQQGKPQWLVRSDSKLYKAASDKGRIVNQWTHLVGVLTKDGKAELYVNGELAVRIDAVLIAAEPKQTMEIGDDAGSTVGEYTTPLPFAGLIDEVNIYHGEVTAKEIAARAQGPEKGKIAAANVLKLSFDESNASDASGNRNNGQAKGIASAEGQFGKAMKFAGSPTRKGAGRPGNPQPGGYYVKKDWNTDVPIMVQGIVLADQTLFIAGAPDLIDETKAWAQLTQGNQETIKQMHEQNDALAGKKGGILWAVDARSGDRLAEIKLDSLPVWDGLIAAQGSLYMATQDGRIIRMSGEK